MLERAKEATRYGKYTSVEYAIPSFGLSISSSGKRNFAG